MKPILATGLVVRNFESISFFVPGIPAPAGSKRGFIPKGCKRAVIVDACKRSKPWQQEIKGVAMDNTPKDAAGSEYLLTCPLAVTFQFLIHRPAGHYGSGKNAESVKASSPKHPAKKPDVLKLARCVEDALTNVIWQDDAQIVHEIISKQYVKRTDQSGVVIIIEEAS